jgi:hypothetical protein
MPGLGRKVFNAGEVLSAVNVQGYLQDQVVQVYSGTTARSSALGTAVSEGMASYLTDSNSLEVYTANGTAAAWSPVSLQQTANAVINGGFDIWQRGTSVAIPSNSGIAYAPDRWSTVTAVGQQMTISRQVTGDTTNLPNIQYAARYQRNSGQTSTSGIFFSQSIETVNAIPLAGRPFTFSFYARRGANYSPTSNILTALVYSGTGTDQNVLGGYTGNVNAGSADFTLTTTWQRFTISGTFATNITEIAPIFYYVPTGTAGAADFFEVTGVQLEAGSVATPFKRNANNLQGELAACQRYYQRITASGLFSFMRTTGGATLTTQVTADTPAIVTMRATPTSVDFSSNLRLINYQESIIQSVTSITFFSLASNPDCLSTQINVSSGLTVGSAFRLQSNNNSTAFIGFSAEL